MPKCPHIASNPNTDNCLLTIRTDVLQFSGRFWGCDITPRVRITPRSRVQRARRSCSHTPSVRHRQWIFSDVSVSVLRSVYRVVALGRDDFGGVWVPQQQIGVRAHGDAPFARVQVENLGGVGAGHRNKLVFVHFPRHLKGSRIVGFMC